MRLFLKDPKFPLRNPKRFLEGLLDQYVSSIAATHYDVHTVDPELPLLLSAALVSLLRVHPALADHVGYLGYVPKLVAAMAYEGRRETMASGEMKNGQAHPEEFYENEDEQLQPSTQTPQERVRLSCLRVLHQLAASTTCAEAMATTSVGTPQVWVVYAMLFVLCMSFKFSVHYVVCSIITCNDNLSLGWDHFPNLIN